MSFLFSEGMGSEPKKALGVSMSVPKLNGIGNQTKFNRKRDLSMTDGRSVKGLLDHTHRDNS